MKLCICLGYSVFAFQIQRDAEETQRMLFTHAGTLQHAATQTVTQQDSIKADNATSSGITPHMQL